VGVIFISHSSKNNAEAVAVRDWLRAEGYGETSPEHGLVSRQRGTPKAIDGFLTLRLPKQWWSKQDWED
jgi:hypothetical protein